MNIQRNGVFIPDRFRNLIGLHLMKNVIVSSSFPTPLILGIHGPPGEGKTFQCERILEEMQIEVIRISAKDFENELAGEPGAMLVNRYQRASELVLRQQVNGAVLLINDLDAGLGNFGDGVQYTVNTQIVLATLMEMADYPERVGGEATARVPMIATGNDFTKLYEPLTREGRMAAVSWVPTVDEKIQVVRRNLLSSTSITDEEVAKLVTMFSEKPVAFFASLHSAVYDDFLLSRIERVAPADILDVARELRKELVSIPMYDFGLLLAKARTLRADPIVSHLARQNGTASPVTPLVVSPNGVATN